MSYSMECGFFVDGEMVEADLLAFELPPRLGEEIRWRQTGWRVRRIVHRERADAAFSPAIEADLLDAPSEMVDQWRSMIEGNRRYD